MTIAVLAVQGAFIEHEKKLEKLGASCIELRKAEDLERITMVWYFREEKARYRENCSKNLECTTLSNLR